MVGAGWGAIVRRRTFKLRFVAGWSEESADYSRPQSQRGNAELGKIAPARDSQMNLPFVRHDHTSDYFRRDLTSIDERQTIREYAHVHSESKFYTLGRRPALRREVCRHARIPVQICEQSQTS
jgi:hypothetical protein